MFQLGRKVTEPQYVKRTCPECGVDEMQIYPYDASVLFPALTVGMLQPAWWWLPRFERDVESASGPPSDQ